ncbi:hypothetical protein IPC1343_14425 [Pseudomonas aeruginosa]|uniref:hypothetical protein n=1 Tax=Pseudomonas aeruginosa TaxID=287 RepID=UPI0003BB061C|nr:hypothetical protein [Pseudomonas aeruginosa]ERY94314.1 hypothetical protein Q023_01233 [Pseudomonas aeruginosa BWHPSA010]KSI60091.1 hypothetical protein AO985_03950 [Pseudomonas aeruginosa]TEG17715.1 hypothetical protein IPC1343_14425 [Pseudomonas aeruginosa]
MEAKTYTKRENARRAGVAAGVPAELVEITVHKSAEGVRFGWKAMEAPAPAAEAAPADAVVTTSKPKKAAAPKVERVEQNGVKRPGPGKCLEVWEYLDQHGNMKPKDLQPVAEAKGWNINNVQIELYQWRKFNGISGRATVTS